MHVLRKLVLGVLVTISCHPTEKTNKREINKELQDLHNKVLALQGLISQIDSFIANDFTNCSNSLPPFQANICKIAQTATAEQKVLFSGQIQEVLKNFQEKIYGVDCLNDTELGCPISGSILERLTTVENSSGDILADILTLQSDVATIQGNITTINTRLNNFNGSGQSVETIITGLEADIDNLDSRLDSVEQTLASGSVWKTLQICEDIVSSGPVFEAVLVTGDNTEVSAYIYTNSSKNGLGVVSKAGVSGDKYLTTRLNTNTCKFKIYDLSSSVKICWKNTDRSASSAAIDTSCDSANSFVTPLLSCTCVN